ncbi:MAG: 2-C-methyl-D-erythritol 2,4-cyclodiphosphate synthase [Acidobacteria bacterium]|nr:2-C-methyl-D-erythritol 2,4-cyclodiphosphate synthase [Acidobacteriota bacterium]
MYRIGTGMDVHAFAPDRQLMLGCVAVDHPVGLQGHSDADVLVHAITDAILGALGERDIGWFYPPDDPQWKGYPGSRFLRDMKKLLGERGYQVVNLDAVIMAEHPKLSPYIPRMTAQIAEHLGVTTDRIGIKATTSEGLGFTGRGDGILANAVVLLKRNPADVTA